MKTSSTLALATLGLAAILAPLQLAAQSSNLYVTVPFDFTIGSKALPAGDYRVSTERGVIRMDCLDGDCHMAALGHAVDAERGDIKTALVFKHYGDRYFLAQIWSGTERGTELPDSAVERELSAKTQSATPVTLLAWRH